MEEKEPKKKKRTTKKSKPEAQVEETAIESYVTAYVIDERSGNCVFVLSNVAFPEKDDHIVLYKDGYGFEMIVTKKTFIIDARSASIARNIYVVPIGAPWKLPELPDDDNTPTKEDQNKNELLN